MVSIGPEVKRYDTCLDFCASRKVIVWAQAHDVIPVATGIQCTMHKQPAVYILASKRNGTLYIGVTSNLQKRAWEHKNDFAQGFTKRYGVQRLVYFELCEDMMSAIRREKQMKKWNQAWKLELIEKQNPAWRDLWEKIV